MSTDIPTPLNTSLLDRLSDELSAAREYSIRLPDPDAEDLFVTDDLSMAIQFRQHGVCHGKLPEGVHVYDDYGRKYELYYIGGESVVLRDKRFYANWISGKAQGEARV